jgi:hypothetical protein
MNGCNCTEMSMSVRQWMQLAAIASSLGFAGAALGADAGMTLTQMQNGASPAGSAEGAIAPGAESVGGSERIDNTNHVPLADAWMIDGEAGILYDSSRVIYVLPGDAGAAREPDAGQVLDVAPDEPLELYRLPQDRDMLSDATPPPSASGMQATPGYVRPGSAKAQ